MEVRLKSAIDSVRQSQFCELLKVSRNEGRNETTTALTYGKLVVSMFWNIFRHVDFAARTLGFAFNLLPFLQY